MLFLLESIIDVQFSITSVIIFKIIFNKKTVIATKTLHIALMRFDNKVHTNLRYFKYFSKFNHKSANKWIRKLKKNMS